MYLLIFFYKNPRYIKIEITMPTNRQVDSISTINLDNVIDDLNPIRKIDEIVEADEAVVAAAASSSSSESESESKSPDREPALPAGAEIASAGATDNFIDYLENYLQSLRES